MQSTLRITLAIATFMIHSLILSSDKADHQAPLGTVAGTFQNTAVIINSTSSIAWGALKLTAAACVVYGTYKVCTVGPRKIVHDALDMMRSAHKSQKNKDLEISPKAREVLEDAVKTSNDSLSASIKLFQLGNQSHDRIRKLLRYTEHQSKMAETIGSKLETAADFYLTAARKLKQITDNDRTQ